MNFACGAALALLLLSGTGCEDDGSAAGDPGDAGATDGGQAGEGGDGPGEGAGGEGAGEGEGEGGEGESAGADGGTTRPEGPVTPWAPVVGLSGKVVTGLRVLNTKPPTAWASTRRRGLYKASLDIDGSFERVATPDDDIADVVVDGDGITILLQDDGPWRSQDDGRTWTPLRAGWANVQAPLALAASRPVGHRLVSTTVGLFAVTTGGLLRWREGEWTLVSLSEGPLNPAVEALHEDEDGVLYAGMASLEAFVGDDLAEEVRTVLHRSEDGGATWRPFDDGVDSRHVTAFASDGGRLFAATNGGGVVRLDRATDRWEPLPVADLQVLGIWAIPGGGVVLAGANGWMQASVNGGDDWFDVTGGLQGFPPVISAAFVPEAGTHMLAGVAGEGVWATEDILGAPPAQRSDREVIDDGKVEIALSFHVNLQHADRGDTNDDEGFGRDIRGLTEILDMLDAHPRVRADWEFESASSLERLLPRHAPDVLERIVGRVTRPDATRDGLRITSWNGGMAGAMTGDELRESLLRAKDSYRSVFGQVLDPGVQPTGHMFSPDHLDILTQEDLGLEWITLFYSATHLTGFRRDALLTLHQAHNVLTLKRTAEDDTDSTLKLIPLYHHADVVDHGGLLGWARQLHTAMPDRDALIAIHFDAAAQSWLGFEHEIRAVEEAEDPAIRWSTLHGYYRRHSARPAGDVVLARDVAAGVHDGWGSWSEKWINREVFTPIDRSRLKDAGAYELLRKVDRPQRGPVLDARAVAMTERLKALSAAHFGMANPGLHPARRAAALDQAAAAEAAADEALNLAVARLGPDSLPPAGERWLFHSSGEAFDGVARIPVDFKASDEHDPDMLTARMHRIGDEDSLGSRVPGQLIHYTTHGDGTVATGEFWLRATLEAGEIAGVSFESPLRAPIFGDTVSTERARLTQPGHVDVRFGQDGAPFQARVYLDDETYIPIGDEAEQGPWWRPWITWQGERLAPEDYEIVDVDDGWRGFTAAKRLAASVDVPGGGTWEVAYTFRTVKDVRALLLEVETTYPGQADAPDPRLTETVPVGLYPWIFKRETYDHDQDEETPEIWNRDWVERHVVWRETFRGSWSGFPVQEYRDSVNAAAAMGWAGVFTTLVAFDRWQRSSPAFVPMRFLKGQGLDLRPLLAPFGSFDGEPPDPRPERTRGSGVGARLSRLAAHQGPSAPNQAGRTERFSLLLGPVPATLGGALSARPTGDDIQVARAWSDRPLVLTPPGR